MLEPAPSSVYLDHPSDWEWLGDKLLHASANGVVPGADTETLGCDPRDDEAVGRARVVLWSCAIPDGVARPRGYREATGFVLPPRSLLTPSIRYWLEDPHSPKIFHNARYDRHALANEGVWVRGAYDSVDIYRTVRPGLAHYSAKGLAQMVLGIETLGAFRDVFSRSVTLRRVKVQKYKVCVVHGRAESRRRKYCEVCDEELVEMTEEIETVSEGARKEPIRLQEVCGVKVSSNLGQWEPLEIDPDTTTEIWQRAVDYAGLDALIAGWLFQTAGSEIDSGRQAKIPNLDGLM